MMYSKTSAEEIGEKVGGTKGKVECAGNSLYYEVVGEGHPIAFLHDGLLHRVAFDNLVDAFKDSYTLVRFDRPGYGNSPPPSVSFSHVLTVDDLLSKMGIQACVLVGGSAGGRIAIDYALTRPEKVSALILVGAALSGFEFTDHMFYRGWRNVLGNSPEEMIEFWYQDPWLIANENIEAKQIFRDTLRSSPNNLEHYSVEVLDDYEAIDRLSEIDAPTLIVIGESDIADNHAISGILHNGIPDSRREIVTGSGHLVYLEKPDEFTKLMVEFLEEMGNSGSA